MLRHQLLHARAVRRVDVREDDVLLCGQPDVRAQLVDELAQPGPRSHLVDVGDAAVLDENAHVESAIALLVPPQGVVDRLPGQLLRRLELEGHATLHLVAEPVEPPVGDRVLEPCAPPVAPVAIVALTSDNTARYLDSLTALP